MTVGLGMSRNGAGPAPDMLRLSGWLCGGTPDHTVARLRGIASRSHAMARHPARTGRLVRPRPGRVARAGVCPCHAAASQALHTYRQAIPWTDYTIGAVSSPAVLWRGKTVVPKPARPGRVV
jgi:hypothetical protein